MSSSNWRVSVEEWFRGIMFPTYERDQGGLDFYYVDGDDQYSESSTNMAYAQGHPILTPALLFISNLFAQAKFQVEDTNGDKTINHRIIKLLAKPNYYQNQIDFLEELQFLKLAQGKVGIYIKKGVGLEVDSMFCLLDSLIKWPEDFEFKFSFRDRSSSYFNQKIVYDENGQNLEIRLKDIIWLHDLPAVKSGTNNLLNWSRLDSMHQTLDNTKDSLIAKNIVLKSNGKEMLSAADKGFPMSPDEQDKAKQAWSQKYGLGADKSRLYITKAGVNWQSLHIALRDLGLDESVGTDSKIIYTALNLPLSLVSLSSGNVTYNNFREALAGYTQGTIQSMMNDLLTALNAEFMSEGSYLVANYDHLPSMQFLEKRKFEAIRTQAEALTKLRFAGLPDDVALDLVGLPSDTVLTELEKLPSSGSDSTQTGSSETGQETGGTSD